jgi:glycosyltransferase involved in cell wall biosynthesis
MATVAFVSPLPPAKTGIATYAASVLEGLDQLDAASGHTIDPVSPFEPDAGARVRAADVGIYQIGNNVEFHGDIYALSVWHPGVVVLHDLAVDGLIWGLGEVRSPLAAPARQEAIAATPRGADHDDPLGVPWCAQLVRRARAVIVHSGFAKSYLERIGCLTPVLVAPHPTVEREADIERARVRGHELRAGVAGPDEVVVGVAGDLNATKGIPQLLEALAHVRSTVRLVLVGRRGGWDVDAAIRDAGVGGRVSVFADVLDSEFLAWLIAFDVLVNLRYPHRGESSGSLVRALQVGTPTIVSGVGTYLEVPDDVVVRTGPGRPDPEELAAVIDRFAGDPEGRAAIGDRARAYARDALAPTTTAAVYLEAIDDLVALRADPVRNAIARWARGLRPAGLGPRHAARGLGVRYPEALFELRREEHG